MDSNFELFLSNMKFNYINEKNVSDSFSNDRVIYFDKRKIDNFTFNVFTYKLYYPISFDKLITEDCSLKDNCMEEKFDTTILIECNDNDKNLSYDINDVAYSSMSNIEDAKNVYDKLHNIIFNDNSFEDIFKKLYIILNYN